MSTYTHTRRTGGQSSTQGRQPRDRVGRFGQKPRAEADTTLTAADPADKPATVAASSAAARAVDAGPDPDSTDWADQGLPPPPPDPVRDPPGTIHEIDLAETDHDLPPDDFDADLYGRLEDRMLDAQLGPW